ncbi:CDP-glycerol glycerophosphotransferase family protein [Brevibacterium album]|uniref:CDP-glycerol glycerophosphotransferase family protein n=1 Tax=Brevibacterium album TaxID=417948 RepID=UPI0006876760|nr:CDP-glycerol glycerophosphotransferase family protein [Brevibacterium album]
MSRLRPRAVASKAVSAVRRGTALARRAGGTAADRLAAARTSRVLGPRDDDAFTVIVHFAGDAASAYQLEQWLWPLERLAAEESVGILCRGARTAERIAGRTGLPVRYGRSIADLDAVLGAESVRCVLYVNQATQNFHALRHPRPAHVHLSHGESEKASMVTNQLKAYDLVFTAGEAARERLRSQLIGFGEDRMIDVGRPQLDQPRPLPREWMDFAASHPARPGKTVLWAPTWEGDSSSMAYGTLTRSGEALVRELASAGARIIYRPHPRTGFLDREFRNAHRRVSELVAQAGGFVDVTPAVGWQFDVADACIAEMSSVAFDWLATHKPLALLEPADARAVRQRGGLFDRVPSFPAENAAQAVASVLRQLPGVSGGHGGAAGEGGGASGAETDTRELAAAAEHYLGDTAPGAQMRRFADAVRRVAEERVILLRARAG